MIARARMRPLRVAVDVRIPANQWGGVQQLAEGIARGLSELDGDEEYVFLGYADAASWLEPLLGGSTRRVQVPRAWGRSSIRRAYDGMATLAPGLARSVGRVAASVGSRAIRIPNSDGRVEALGVDVIHFVTPQAYQTRVPSLYQPLDLLHVHQPEQFSPLHRAYREQAYRAYCEQARWVISMTRWGRTDIADHYGIDIGRIAVVPLPPVVEANLSDVDQRVSVEPYLLYPAQTWPHKNHLALIGALSVLRDRTLNVRVVCTGRLTDHYGEIAAYATAQGVADRITFVGYVPERQLGSLYGNALGVVFPSKFEGWGLPIVEAFAAGIPVACSDIPVLREVAGDAAVYFDPLNPRSIADCLARLWTDGRLRRTLGAAGLKRVQGMTWRRTATTFRALYRQTAGITLSDDDLALLQSPTVVDA